VLQLLTNGLVLNKLERYFHARQRRAQFMTDIQKQLFPRLHHLTDSRRHVIERSGQAAEFII
jgi:hypothetical protein